MADETGAPPPYTPRPTASLLTSLGRRPSDVIDRAYQSIGLLTRDGDWIWASPELERLLQRNITDGEPFWLAGRPRDLEGVAEGLAEALATPGVPVPVRGRVHLSEDSYFVVEGTLTGLLDVAGVEGLLLSIVDVTDRVEADLALQRAAAQDQLTGLSNRFVLDERLSDTLARARRREERFAVLYFDLDNFKMINDTHGHDAGDRVLVEVARRLRERLRAEDILSRIGGDEFVIVTGTEPDLPPDNVRHLCDLIRESLAVPIDIGEREVTTSASIGVVIDDGHRTPAELLRDADVAMYEAKNDGRARYSFHSRVMTQHAIARARLRERVVDAVTQGAVTVHFQPIVDVESGGVLAYEALARVELGGSLAFPADFLPAVEAAGIMPRLGDLVLARALEAVAGWDESISVSVNITGDLLRDDGFADRLRSVLDGSGVAPSRVVLEIPESVMVSGDDDVGTSLRRLRRMGVRLAVDHFGAGMRALKTIEEYLVSWVKLDGELIADLERAGADHLLSAATAFADERAVTVVAERVEDEDTKRWLTGAGVRYVQGFVSGRPRPAPAAQADRVVDVTSDDDSVRIDRR